MGTKSVELVPISLFNDRSQKITPSYCYCGRFILESPYGQSGRGTPVIRIARRTWYSESPPSAFD